MPGRTALIPRARTRVQSLAVTLVVEFLVLTVPTALAFTKAELTVPLLAGVYATAGVLNLLSWKHAREFVNKHCRKEKMNQLLERELPFLTCFRAQIMHSTCVQCAENEGQRSEKHTL